MKILVLSDSHSGLSFMRHCIGAVNPQHVIHLGDFFGDATAMAEENPHIRFHQVPGNGDSVLCRNFPGILCYAIGGVKFYMTHGHFHGVKSDLNRLLMAAREEEADAVLFGHTHEALCFQESDGLLVLNPGSCRSWGGSVGLLEVEDGRILSSRILHGEQLCQSKDE